MNLVKKINPLSLQVLVWIKLYFMFQTFMFCINVKFELFNERTHIWSIKSDSEKAKIFKWKIKTYLIVKYVYQLSTLYSY